VSDPLNGAVLTRNGGDTLYVQLARILREAIVDGRYAAGTLLPSEHELCRAFDVSRPVVRQALDQLAQEGHVYRVRGKGTFASDRKLDSALMQVGAGSERDTVRFRDRLRTQVRETATIAADVEVARLLNVKVGADVHRIVRLRQLDGEPLCVLESFLPAHPFPGLLDRSLEDASLYETIEGAYGREITEITRTIESTRASAEDAPLLGVAPGEPCLVVRSLASAGNGAALEWSYVRYRGDRIALTTTFSSRAPGAER
jgi:GntR family transcriptional regulator